MRLLGGGVVIGGDNDQDLHLPEAHPFTGTPPLSIRKMWGCHSNQMSRRGPDRQ